MLFLLRKAGTRHLPGKVGGLCFFPAKSAELLIRTEVMSATLPGPSSAKGKTRLKIDRLYRAASTVERNLNKIVENIINDLLDSSKPHSLKEKAAALRALSSMTLDKDRLRDDLGIKSERSRSDNPLLLILGGDVDITVLKSLPSEEREKLILSALTNEKDKARQILEPKTITLLPEQVKVSEGV